MSDQDNTAPLRSLADLRELTADQINERWPEVQQVLANPQPDQSNEEASDDA